MFKLRSRSCLLIFADVPVIAIEDNVQKGSQCLTAYNVYLIAWMYYGASDQEENRQSPEVTILMANSIFTWTE